MFCFYFCCWLLYLLFGRSYILGICLDWRLVDFFFCKLDFGVCIFLFWNLGLIELLWLDRFFCIDYRKCSVRSWCGKILGISDCFWFLFFAVRYSWLGRLLCRGYRLCNVFCCLGCGLEWYDYDNGAVDRLVFLGIFVFCVWWMCVGWLFRYYEFGCWNLLIIFLRLWFYCFLLCLLENDSCCY